MSSIRGLARQLRWLFRQQMSSNNPRRLMGIKHQGFSDGGLSPVFSTSFSMVTVVVPPGVETFTSLVVDDFSVHPTAPSENKLRTKTDANNCFMFLLFQLNMVDTAGFTAKPAAFSPKLRHYFLRGLNSGAVRCGPRAVGRPERSPPNPARRWDRSPSFGCGPR